MIYRFYYNDLIDSKAKTAAKDAYDIPTSADLTTLTCKKMTANYSSSFLVAFCCLPVVLLHL